MNKKGLATKPKPEPFTLLLKILFLILLLLGIGLPSTVFGQGDIQVDPTTGRANMTIPITTLRSKDIQHPVGLSYSTGGFKVGTPIGKAGLGWSLLAGGMISRELRGLPDDFEEANRKGWLKSTAGSQTSSFSPTADDNWANASDEGSDHTALAAFGGYDGTGTILDTEPDIFYINAAGVGGSFILHHDGTIKSMPYNDYEIVPTYDNGELESFEITNAAGITYHFDQSDEQTIQSYQNTSGGAVMLDVRNYQSFVNPITFKKNWYLTEITSAMGGQMTFHYQLVQHSDFTETYRVNSWVPERQDTLKTYRYNTQTSEYEEHWEYYLKVSETRPYDLRTITCTTGRVDFRQGDVLLPSTYVPPGGNNGNPSRMKRPLISQITVSQLSRKDSKDWYTFKQSFSLNYGFATLLNDIDAHQVFLKSVSRQGLNQKSLDLYHFSYSGIEFGQEAYIPPAQSWSQDYFGYFNGEASNKLQKLYVHPNQDNPYRFSPYPIAGEEIFVLEGRDGKPNLRGILPGTLKKVTNRLGGTTEVTYELNQAFDVQYNRDVYGGGVRVKQVRVHDGMDRANDQVIEYEYQQTNGNSSGLFLHLPTYAFNVGLGWNFSTQQPVQYKNLLSQNLSAKDLWLRTTLRTERDSRFEAQDGASLVYDRVTIKQEGKGRTEYEYDWPIANQTLSVTGWNSAKNKLAREAVPSRTYQLGELSLYQSFPHGPLPKPNHLQGLLNTVRVYDEAGNIEQETVNTYQFLNTEPIQALRIGQLPMVATSGATEFNEDMFVYRRYELQTGNTPLMQFSTTKSYDAIDQNQWQTVTSETVYPAATAAYPTYPTHQFSTDSRGIKRGVRYTYPFNYAPPSSGLQDDATKAIGEMNNKHILAMPIEVRQTYQEGAGSEQVLGASLSEYEYIASQDILKMDKQFALRLDGPVSNFQNSMIMGTGPYSLSKDSRYELQSEVTERDQWGNALTREGISRVPVTTLSAMQATLPGASFSLATYDQVAYEDFETRDLENQGGFLHPDSPVTGRISGNGVSLTSSTELSKQLKKDGDSDFLVSLWYNASTSGTLTITCTQGASTVTATKAFQSTSAAWTYHESLLDLSTLGNDFTVTITTSATVSLDDVAVHPKEASMTYATYDANLFAVAQTSNGGITVQTVRDDLMRVWHQKNLKGEVTGVFEFPTGNQSLPDHFANIGGKTKLKPEESTTLYQINPINTGGTAASYEWVSGPTTIDYQNPSSLTYTHTGESFPINFSTEGVRVVVLKSTFATQTTYDYVLIEVETPTAVNLCLEGIIFYNTCSNATSNDHLRSTCSQLSGVGTLETKFLAEVTGATATSYQWQQKTDLPGQQWQNMSAVSGNPDQYLLTSYGSDNILVRCVVQTSEGTITSVAEEIYVAELNDCQTGLN